MTAIRRTAVLGLAVLLAVPTAAADTVITAEEVISCSVVLCDTNFTRLSLPSGGIRMLHTRDVREIRLSDSSRVAELTALLPDVRVTWPAEVLDTLAPNATRTQMVARCNEAKAVLLECGRSDAAVVGLLQDVASEARALDRIRPQATTHLMSGSCGGLLVGPIGALVGAGMAPTPVTGLGCSELASGCGYGCAAGSVLGVVAGMTIGAVCRENQIARHRSRVNDLVRRVNLAVVTAP